jgi:hypothetical protein
MAPGSGQHAVQLNSRKAQWMPDRFARKRSVALFRPKTAIPRQQMHWILAVARGLYLVMQGAGHKTS